MTDAEIFAEWMARYKRERDEARRLAESLRDWICDKVVFDHRCSRVEDLPIDGTLPWEKER